MTGPRDLIERALRQLLQTYGPVIYVVLTSAVAHGAPAALVTALASVTVLTTLKWIARLRAGADAPAGLALLDRAGSAFATTLIGLGVTDLASLLSLDWGKALQAGVVAAVLAVLTYYGLPPAVPPSPDPNPDAAPSTTRRPGLFDPADAPYDRDARNRPEGD